MIKKLLAIGVLMAILCTMAGARMPVVGDSVRIATGSSPSLLKYDGVVTDIGDGFICLESTRAWGTDRTLWEKPTDVCIGIGSIITLVWLDEEGEPISEKNK